MVPKVLTFRGHARYPAIKQGNVRVAAMKPILRDAHLTMRIKRLLMLTALRPCLEFASEVLVPSRKHCRALESVQLKAARLILGCPTLTAFEAGRSDLQLSLLGSDCNRDDCTLMSNVVKMTSE